MEVDSEMRRKEFRVFRGSGDPLFFGDIRSKNPKKDLSRNHRIWPLLCLNFYMMGLTNARRGTKIYTMNIS